MIALTALPKPFRISSGYLIKSRHTIQIVSTGDNEMYPLYTDANTKAIGGEQAQHGIEKPVIFVSCPMRLLGCAV